jgi:hypothetical protein
MCNRLRLQGWICITCERTFTRRWNANRHAADQHSGHLTQIVSVIEYLAGRQSGIYQPASLSNNRKQSSSAPLSARKSATNMQDILHIFDFESTKKVNPEGGSLAHVMTKEFAGEIARQAAVNYVSKARQQSQATVISNMHLLWQSPFLSDIVIPRGNSGDIFGYRCHICSKCLLTQLLAISYPPNEQIGAIIEEKHWCDPSIIARNQNLDKNVKETRVKIMRQSLPKYLKNVVNAWSKGYASIAGIELSSSLSTRAPRNDQRFCILRTHEDQ